MIDMVRSSEGLLRERLGRRGFTEDDCRQLLQSSNGNVIFPKKYSLRQSNLKI
ncbi:MAG TPA: hypothetical protein GXZ24_00395 [Firmicutes bacterium]|nr:hypothetical protein [Bacillota bacterium]